jgi:ectoine hydroxylase-related dioxygenase (phytanoyl-CoA dioxygenase family)
VIRSVAVAVAVALLGTEFEVAGPSLRVPLPGFGHQGLHQDIESPPDPATWELVRITWVLSPFTVETGTFRYIPGSHLTGPPTEAGVGLPPYPDEVRVVAVPGAIVLKSAHVWHSGTFNGSVEPRLSVDVDYRASQAATGPSLEHNAH